METREKGQIFNCHSKNWPQYHACLSVHLGQYIINKNDSKTLLYLCCSRHWRREAGRVGGERDSAKERTVSWFQTECMRGHSLPTPANSRSIVIVSFALCCFDFAGPRFERTKTLLFITSVVLNFVYMSLVLNGSGSVRDHISDLRRDGIDLTGHVPLATIPSKEREIFQFKAMLLVSIYIWLLVLERDNINELSVNLKLRTAQTKQFLVYIFAAVTATCLFLNENSINVL